jgi:4-amino-4-deoxy-L-arabinose transferase-like glycosyltransferase
VQLLTLRPAVVIGEPYFIATYILEGLGYVYPYPGDILPTTTAYIPPLYVWLLVLILKFGGTLVTIQIVNLVMLQIGNILIYRIFKSILGAGLGFLGYFAISFYVPLWLLAAAIEPNALNHMLLASMILLLLQIYHRPQVKGTWALLGLSIGAQVLVRPDMLIGIPFVAAWLWFALKSSVDTKLLVRRSLLSLALLMLCVGPWTLRNYLVFDSFILVSANSGYNLFIGSNVGATGEFMIIPETPEETAELKRIEREASLYSALGRDRFYFKEAVNWLANNPVEAIGLAFRKVFYHWWRRDASGSGLQMQQWLILYDVLTLVLLTAGFYGLARLRDRNVKMLFLTLFAYSTLVSAIFFVQSRHRAIKVDPYLLPLAVGSLVALVVRSTSSKTAEHNLEALTL